MLSSICTEVSISIRELKEQSFNSYIWLLYLKLMIHILVERLCFLEVYHGLKRARLTRSLCIQYDRNFDAGCACWSAKMYAYMLFSTNVDAHRSEIHGYM